MKQNSSVLAGVVLVLAAVGGVILYRRKRA
ncbi:MAG TPA: LPXTG cell wall anchor domain-containing protein [Candidatus Ligilactobacillus excrementipullorum]|nr:LPXTG cell wall anchor domain-containing protein [Candidatus Ligilactobacillus excrementipullorum]